jgi:hypothetical protein
MALPALSSRPEPVTLSVVARNMRRCTFRRLERIGDGPESEYEVTCLYPERRLPLLLGDLPAAIDACAGCAATGVFRPDED